MVPGEGDTWHVRYHNHRLLHVIDVRKEDMLGGGGGGGGGVSHPPSIKVAIEKK